MWHIPVDTVLGRLRQEDSENSLGYTAKPSLNKLKTEIRAGYHQGQLDSKPAVATEARVWGAEAHGLWRSSELLKTAKCWAPI